MQIPRRLRRLGMTKAGERSLLCGFADEAEVLHGHARESEVLRGEVGVDETAEVGLHNLHDEELH